MSNTTKNTTANKLRDLVREPSDLTQSALGLLRQIGKQPEETKRAILQVVQTNGHKPACDALLKAIYEQSESSEEFMANYSYFFGRNDSATRQKYEKAFQMESLTAKSEKATLDDALAGWS